MRHINDTLRESLLDDNLESSVDTQMLGEWIKQNISGKYKVIALKDGTFKFWGDVLIKKYDGEAFPDNFIISSMQGDFKIEKCPNLKHIRGLFKSFSDVDGDYSVSNCPKLESVEGGPMAVKGTLSFTGNSSLKTLDGMPQFIYETIYIMKNGKRFSQKDIESHVLVPQRIVCSVEEELNESVVNEALNEPHLLELVKQLKANGRLVKRYLDLRRVKLDELDSSNVKEYTKIDAKATKAASEVVRGTGIADNFGFVILVNSNHEFLCFIDSNKNCLPIKQGWKPSKYWEFSEYGSQLSYTDIMNEIKYHAYSLIVVKWGFEEYNAANQLQSNRKAAKEGMILNDAKQNEEIAKQNVQRYKALIAQMKVQKDKEFEEIDAAVEQVVMDALKISQQAKRNPEKYRPYQVRLLNEKIYGEEHYTGYNARTGKSTMGDNGLLLAYTRYTESYMDVAKNGGDEWDRRSLKNTAKEIWEMIKNIQRIINTYK